MPKTLTKFHYIYGPVYSWRLGNSLGIDPLSLSRKICNFDCVYCQLGKTPVLIHERKIFVKTAEIVKEIMRLPKLKIDHITFSGRGEPTLAKNLGSMIQAVRKVRNEKIAVITNSSLIDRHDVQEELSLADVVVAKLDACSQESLEAVDKTGCEISFKNILSGLKKFRKLYKGRLAIQIMVIAQNKHLVPQIAQHVHSIHPDEVQLDTPLRPSAALPISSDEMARLKNHFRGLPIVTAYDRDIKNVIPLNLRDTVKRHGRYLTKSLKHYIL